ncbi:MAG: regulatory protein RecX, partial [Solirubrobacteraceae bacterium]
MIDGGMPDAQNAPPAAVAAGLDVADPEAQLQRALELGCAYLNRRDRTVDEVRMQLRRRGVSEHLIDAAVQILVQQRLLDDERFARLFVSDKRELEQWGSERIRRGLEARGIDRRLDVIDLLLI